MAQKITKEDIEEYFKNELKHCTDNGYYDCLHEVSEILVKIGEFSSLVEMDKEPEGEV